MGRTFTEIYEREKMKPTPAQIFIARIAKATGKSDVCIRDWISGRRIPDKPNRDAIARELKQNVNTLFPEA